MKTDDPTVADKAVTNFATYQTTAGYLSVGLIECLNPAGPQSFVIVVGSYVRVYPDNQSAPFDVEYYRGYKDEKTIGARLIHGQIADNVAFHFMSPTAHGKYELYHRHSDGSIHLIHQGVY